jgi:hypothetical protein
MVPFRKRASASSRSSSCSIAGVVFAAKSLEQPAKDSARQKSEVPSLGHSLEDAMLWFESAGREAAVVVNSVSRMEIAGIVTESYVLKRYAPERRRIHE